MQVRRDAEAVLIYAAENATQRGESSTAGAGTVAAATWLLARAIMKGHVSEISETCTPKAAEILQGQIASAKGLGASEKGLGWSRDRRRCNVVAGAGDHERGYGKFAVSPRAD